MNSKNLIGEMLDDKYEVVRHLGQGGFGDVYLATDIAIPKRKVAIKALRQESTVNQNDLIKEMRTLAAINHPNVVDFYHHFIRQGRLHLVMEYCELGSLDDLLGPTHTAPLSQVFNWALELCDTLATIHAERVIHHDIKPANILFTGNGTIKIGDFGIANSLAGTIIYLPPEMLIDQKLSSRDPRPDIYALGITMIEIIAGRHPFLYIPKEKALQKRLQHDFIPNGLPKWASEILVKATHPQKELRFQTAMEFAEAIRTNYVPNVFDVNQIKAYELARKSETSLARKKLRSAERLAFQALDICPNNVAALVAAGRHQIMIRRNDRAEELFSRAISIDKRAHVQKELGWIKLENGWVSSAISLITEHLHVNPTDNSAYNLLLKCYYQSNRFEAGEDLVRMLLKNGAKDECFANNLFLFVVLGNSMTEKDKQFFKKQSSDSPLLSYNMSILFEDPPSWKGNPGVSLKSKLIFQEYHFSSRQKSKSKNTLVVNFDESAPIKTDAFVTTVGSSEHNDLVINDRTVSRRHIAILNFQEDVWLYDLGSTRGTRVADEVVNDGRVFLDGVHQVEIGKVRFRISAKEGLLV